MPSAPAAVRPEAVFRFPVPTGAAAAVLTDLHGGVLARWDVEGASEVTLDLLGPELCSVDGGRPATGSVEDGFIPFPRMRLRLDGVVHELVCGHPEVLRRHYARPAHNAMYYAPDAATNAFHKARVAQVRRLMAGVTGRVLDVGSGHSMLLLAGVPGIRVVACDRDPGPLHSIRDRHHVACVAASADALAFAPSCFDAVYAGEIVEHLPQPQEALRGWVSALRPGGRLVVTTPNRAHLMARLLQREEVVNPEHLFEWSLEELVAAVSTAGAAVTRREGLVMPLPLPVPGRGWRDAVFGMGRRGRTFPEWVHRALAEAGRPLAAWAANIAVVAERRG